MSVACSLVATCWERADILALLYVMVSCVFVTFSYGVPGKVWYLIVSIPDFCLLSYFNNSLSCSTSLLSQNDIFFHHFMLVFNLFIKRNLSLNRQLVVGTVILEIFATVLFSRNFAFVKIKLSQNGKITLSFTDIGKSCLIFEFLTSQICF